MSETGDNNQVAVFARKRLRPAPLHHLEFQRLLHACFGSKAGIPRLPLRMSAFVGKADIQSDPKFGQFYLWLFLK